MGGTFDRGLQGQQFGVERFAPRALGEDLGCEAGDLAVALVQGCALASQVFFGLLARGTQVFFRLKSHAADRDVQVFGFHACPMRGRAREVEFGSVRERGRRRDDRDRGGVARVLGDRIRA